ncbi:MAG: hypothetical protein COV72_03280 [Candidatus Omnitrophica bacterium CG11_big_fil_rev_8_21_14_0_20_42_13]|uniref:Glycosyltransferase 2-like domain-containing protein n=1 Tax=Candidatus Ghiorseimicrobium undicola TaxID=1974746 RepID=A0A2H0LYC0_9BACT|nr:MAG: hypothetical protein COV72_03280 [Candidatus Omnitrophica bacterium CG11_big_fil_rev_8_21_14_0_20_42_13]
MPDKNTTNKISNTAKCDIIILVWNELEATKDCISSILKNTETPYRLIIIDNASQPEARDYLAGLREKFKDLTIVRNEENLGYVKAVNQGIKLSSSEFVCLLNNDTIVCRGWLGEMLNIAVNNFQLGIINPSSNTLAQALPKKYTLEAYAESLNIFKGQWAELGQCSGFCMLIRREVINKIGLFDETYEVGYFEESDYCRRAQRAGYQFARAKAAYVYHIERASFKNLSDKEKIFNKNRKLFESRWGRSLRILCLISKPPKDIIDKDEMDQIIMNSAKDNHRVYVYIRKKLVSEFNLPEHSNILIFPFNDIFYPLASFLKIITKKHTKRFNLILIDGLIFYHILKWFAFIHKAKIMFSPHLERAIEASQKESFGKK